VKIAGGIYFRHPDLNQKFNIEETALCEQIARVSKALGKYILNRL